MRTHDFPQRVRTPEELTMAGVMKKGVGLVVVLFLLWFLFTDPNGAGGMVRDIGETTWDLLTQLFNAVSRFLTTVMA